MATDYLKGDVNSMIFASDNWAGVHPAISASLAVNAEGYAGAYGSSSLDKAVKERFSAIFEREVAVFFTATGTAANSLSLALVSRPGGVTFAHREAHMLQDECGAPEYLSGGCRLYPVSGSSGKIDPVNLEAAIGLFDPGFVHSGRPMAISITQSTEVGTVYSQNEVEAISTIAHRHSVPLHMDGARFANALVALECTPAEITWKRGVDLLSFGGTKNGCWCAEAIVLFEPSRAGELAFVQKRGAQLFSKTRFVAAQFDAYFRDDLWLETARHANRMAKLLSKHIGASNALRLAWEPETNELFAGMRKEVAERLRAKGAVFYPWPTPEAFRDRLACGETLYRFVTSFRTTEEEVERFGKLIR